MRDEGCKKAGVTEADVLAVLRTIDDPEMPISIVDLGIVQSVAVEESRVAVEILPTFVGCPALPVIEDTIRTRVGQLAGIKTVEVKSLFDPPWTPDRISEQGRESLRKHGVTTPQAHVCEHKTEEPQSPRCPFCGADSVKMESAFGPTRCRMIYYCEGCKNTFEHLKKLPLNLV